MDKLILAFCRLGFAGLSPIMPGTCGSALAAVLAPFLFIPLPFVARDLLPSVARRPHRTVIPLADPSRPPDHLWYNSPPQGRPTCGALQIVVRFATTAEKPATSTDAAHTSNSDCEVSPSTHLARCPDSARTRSTSTCTAAAEAQRVSTAPRRPIRTDRRAAAALPTSHVEGPQARVGETKSGSFWR